MTDTIVHYTLGFVFCDEFSPGPGVLLMRKARPEWQKGKLNGIGGHVEPGESFDDAMRREAQEEVGLDVEWECFANMGNNDFHMYLYRVWLPFEQAFLLKAQTDDEPVQWVILSELHHRWDIIPNLRYLVPLAHYREDTFGLECER